MREGLSALIKKDYPGRVIIIGRGKSRDSVLVCYAITGRSSSSQARKLVREGDTIWVRPEEGAIAGGDPELLVYPAICLSRGLVVGNGRQILDIKDALSSSENPAEILARALSKWSYEPDSPIYTPRITGCVLSQRLAALSIIKRGRDGSPLRNIFEVPLREARGWMISTYQGESREALVPFSGEPEELSLEAEGSRESAEAVYEALGPDDGKKDLRVAVACVVCSDFKSGAFDISIINREEKRGSHHGKNR